MNLIVAVDDNWGIGYNGTQPVVVPEDRKHFRELTSGKTVIVGRRTLEDFPNGKPLPKRRNIILTRNASLGIEGAEVVSGIEELFDILSDEEDENVFVIGGASIYEMLADYCEFAYITKIKTAPPADTFFKNLDEDQNWEIYDVSDIKEHEGIEYCFMTYKNNNVKSREII